MVVALAFYDEPQPGGDGQSTAGSQLVNAVPASLLHAIREEHRIRQDLLRMEKAANNQIEAVFRRFTGGLTQAQRARLRKQASRGEGQLRSDYQMADADPADDTANGGDHSPSDTLTTRVPTDLATFLLAEAAAERRCAALYIGRDYYTNARKPHEKRMERLAKELPVWPWVEGVRGFGALGLAQIVAECGDIHNYANPAKVWKRMGLAVMPDGQRQRKVTDAEQAILHGYSPQRRSLVYVIADSLIKNNRDGAYRTYYLAEKERQREKLPDAPQAHIHNRALRHMSKRLLRDLWRAWRATWGLSPIKDMPEPPATFLAAD